MIHSQLYRWYFQEKRILPWRETDNPYFIWVSEIILQQTRVAQGMEYYMRFINRFPTIQSLAEASEDEVLLLWQGLGYYSRARNMHKAAQMILKNATTSENIIFPRTFQEIRALPGVGDYTAGAIASFAYNQSYPALDGNVYRVLARLFDCDIAFDTSLGKKHFHQLAEQLLDREQPCLFNSAIMEFGALYCTPISPECSHCPIGEFCKAYAHNTVDLLPCRKPRPELRDRYLNYYIYLTNDAEHSDIVWTLLHQRQGSDIWKHLWEFPLVESDHLFEVASDISNNVIACMDFTHILSHQRLHARFFVCKEKELPVIPDTLRVPVGELDNYALPKLIQRAIGKMGM